MKKQQQQQQRSEYFLLKIDQMHLFYGLKAITEYKM